MRQVYQNNWQKANMTFNVNYVEYDFNIIKSISHMARTKMQQVIPKIVHVSSIKMMEMEQNERPFDSSPSLSRVTLTQL